MEELIETMKRMSGEELYVKALEFKKEKDYCKYKIYLCMSANYGYENGIQEHEYPDEIIYTDQYQSTNFSDLFKFCELTKNELFSMAGLAKMYSTGRYVQQDLTKTFELYIQSYEKGNKYVVNNLGFEYQHIRNYEKAVEFFEIGVSFGCRDSMNNLAYMYLHGEWVKSNYEKAFELFTMAKTKGNFYANLHLALMYKNGRYVKKNYEKAIDLLEEAISKRLHRGYQYLCDIYKEYSIGRGEKQHVHKYFIESGESEYLKVIYNYTDVVLDLIVKNYQLEKENIRLKKENQEMKNHIEASPEGPLYFEALKQWKLDSTSNSH